MGARLTEVELNVQLDRLSIPRSDDPSGMHGVIRDGVFPLVSELLRQFGQGEWALRPRTFCLLRILGKVDLMDTFVRLKRTDAFLPYDDRNLPDAIKGVGARKKFLDLQSLIASSRHLKELEEEGGEHFTFHSSADGHFSLVKPLGQGGFGIVDHVYGPLTLRNFARKRLHRGASALRDEDSMVNFAKELAALKDASHRHLVKLVSSYTDPIYLGLIMSPVADMDLKVYLKDYMASESDRNARKQYLQTFFGCLISALEYLHDRRIIHKDIKPHNILVKHTDVFLTDFGTARTLGEFSQSYSTGKRTYAVTPRYAAPEVADHATRGQPSDIWSMGCVFLEMATVLNACTLEDMANYYASHGTELTEFWSNEAANDAWIETLRHRSEPANQDPLGWVSLMLKATPKDRPTASQVRAMIIDSNSGNRYFCFHCLHHEGDAVAHPEPSRIYTDHDFVTKPLLDSYTRRHLPQDSHARGGSPFEHLSGQDDDTITSQMLEDAGVVKVRIGTGSDMKTEAAKEKNEEVRRNIPTEDERLSSSTTLRCESDISSPMDDMNIHNTSPGRLKHSDPTKGTKHHLFEQKVTKDEPKPEVPYAFRRFVALDMDTRPQASEPSRPAEDMENMPIVSPEPFAPPPLDMADCHPLPKASLVPSYILAGSNHFTMSEIRSSDPTLGRFNLFVYGPLMFPSILRAFAANSINGVYSPIHQRRLIPTSKDWANVDVSIKHAAEAMTPAQLIGYRVWRPAGMEIAALQHTSWTEAILENRRVNNLEPLDNDIEVDVMGFLVLGVTEEALRYCDLVISWNAKSLEEASKVKPSDQGQNAFQTELMERSNVIVDVQLTSGDFRTVPACTYTWSRGAGSLYHPWRPGEFIRSSQFQDLSSVTGYDWTTEETSLADIMRIAYARLGDELCDAVLSEKHSKLKHMLQHGDDPDARCRKYGTPLQAAVATNKQDMAYLLLQYGANPNLQGGKYGTPLLAATMGSRRGIVELLLKRHANVFASDRQHVNALYQAVGHGDWDIAGLLLEAGAWLSKDYQEVKDLAIERRNSEMQALLQEYDVLKRPRGFLKGGARREEDRKKDYRDDGRGIVRTSSSVLKSVLEKVIVLSGRSGSWRGRKGVEVTRAAIQAGAPPIILDYVRGAYDPVQKLIQALKDTDQAQEELCGAQLETLPRVEELDTDDDESIKETEREESPKKSRNVSDRRTSSAVSRSHSPSSNAYAARAQEKVERRPSRSEERRVLLTPTSHSRRTQEVASPSIDRIYSGMRPESSRDRIEIPSDQAHERQGSSVRRDSLSPYDERYGQKRRSTDLYASPARTAVDLPNIKYSPTVRAKSADTCDPHSSAVSSYPPNDRAFRNADPPKSLPMLYDARPQRRSRDYPIQSHSGVSYRPSPDPRSSRTEARPICQKCNGHGWYREVATVSGSERRREVECRDCNRGKSSV